MIEYYVLRDSKKIVERIKRIGFNPQKRTFIEGVYLMASLATRTWKHKMEVYKRWGWSEEEGLAALMTYPLEIRNEDQSSYGSSGAKDVI